MKPPTPPPWQEFGSKTPNSQPTDPLDHDRKCDGEVRHGINGVIRLYKRDLARFGEAHAVEKKAAPGHKLKSAKTVQMSFEEHRLRHPSEISSLLWYLRASIIYKFGGYNMRPSSDIAILAPDHWHVSFANNEAGKENMTPCSRANPDLSRLI